MVSEPAGFVQRLDTGAGRRLPLIPTVDFSDRADTRILDHPAAGQIH